MERHKESPNFVKIDNLRKGKRTHLAGFEHNVVFA